MAEVTYLEAIRQGLLEEMERDPDVFLMGEDIGAYGGAFKVTEGLMARFGEGRVIDTPHQRDRVRRRRRRRRAHGDAAGLRDAVHRLHLLRLQLPHQLRRHRALSRLPAVPHGRARTERGLRARRAVPFAESRGRVPAHARPQDRLPGHGERREGAAEVRDPRRRLRALLRAQVSLSSHQGRAAGRRSRRADRQGAAGARGNGPLDHHLRRHGVEGARGGGAARERRTACRSRCSTSARCSRWTTRRSWRR